MQPNYNRNFLPLHKGAPIPLIVKPLKLPRHTYTQVSLRLYKAEIGNLVWCYVFKKKQRIATLKRNFDIDLPPTG